MPTLSHEVNDRPMFIPPLQVRKLQIGQFPSPQPTAKEDGENRSVPSALERVGGRRLPEPARLFGCQPVAQSNA